MVIVSKICSQTWPVSVLRKGKICVAIFITLQMCESGWLFNSQNMISAWKQGYVMHWKQANIKGSVSYLSFWIDSNLIVRTLLYYERLFLGCSGDLVYLSFL